MQPNQAHNITGQEKPSKVKAAVAGAAVATPLRINVNKSIEFDGTGVTYDFTNKLGLNFKADDILSAIGSPLESVDLSFLKLALHQAKHSTAIPTTVKNALLGDDKKTNDNSGPGLPMFFLCMKAKLLHEAGEKGKTSVSDFATFEGVQKYLKGVKEIEKSLLNELNQILVGHEEAVGVINSMPNAPIFTQKYNFEKHVFQAIKAGTITEKHRSDITNELNTAAPEVQNMSPEAKPWKTLTDIPGYNKAKGSIDFDVPRILGSMTNQDDTNKIRVGGRWATCGAQKSVFGTFDGWSKQLNNINWWTVILTTIMSIYSIGWGSLDKILGAAVLALVPTIYAAFEKGLADSWYVALGCVVLFGAAYDAVYGGKLKGSIADITDPTFKVTVGSVEVTYAKSIFQRASGVIALLCFFFTIIKIVNNTVKFGESVIYKTWKYAKRDILIKKDQFEKLGGVYWLNGNNVQSNDDINVVTINGTVYIQATLGKIVAAINAGQKMINNGTKEAKAWMDTLRCNNIKKKEE